MNIIKVLKKENSVAKVLHLNARGDSGGGTKRQRSTTVQNTAWSPKKNWVSTIEKIAKSLL